MKLSAHLIIILYCFLSILKGIDGKNQFPIINSEELKLGDKLKESGSKLISQPNGFTKIKSNSTNFCELIEFDGFHQIDSNLIDVIRVKMKNIF